ncbi:MAG: hypothetical protein DWQ35_08605 [Planctomycetota bacterium]|nr:MAG: hypothetical protein DWQ35_08605 [Planctomycetota bacterium]REK22019.1 MAG: hypothetical protein DWQ42_17915 [Planctomycetota bacterium]REK44427.1 MAG: hypothetical protein DWQ46_09200 [Planctomycetota bacterium]
MKATEHLAGARFWVLVIALLGAAALVAYSNFASRDLPPEPPSTATPSEVEVSRVENFRLLDQHGESHELFYYSDARAIVLISHGVGCPINRRYSRRINELQAEFAPRGVRFFLLNANPQDDRTDIKKEADEFQMAQPILKDDTQFVVRGLNVTRTAEALVIDTNTWKIVYRGAIDDRLDYGTQRAEAQHHYLQDALQAFLQGDKVEPARTQPRGCLIRLSGKFDAGHPPPTYTVDVAPILRAKCFACHQEGGIGPWTISDYHEVAGWSSMLGEVVRTKRMPPWGADPEYGHYSNDASLTLEEEKTLLAWIEAGTPRGEGADPFQGQAPVDQGTWSLGEPDVILDFPAQVLPATGILPYRYEWIEIPMDEPGWVRAAEIHMGNKRALHHVVILLAKPGRSFQDLLRESNRSCFVAFVAGNTRYEFPAGTGKFVPAGSRFFVQLHYNSTGREEVDDSTQLALYLSDEEPEHELFVYATSDRSFVVPPGAREYPVTAVTTVTRDMVMYDVGPHMHYRGKSSRLIAEYPDGTSEILISVPYYRFDWQMVYRFAEPKRLPKGTRLVSEGVYDNSAQNTQNPDPSQTVRFGIYSRDEMHKCYFSYRYADEDEPQGDASQGDES